MRIATCLLLCAAACSKPAGPPAHLYVETFQGFDGQHFRGALTLKDENQKQLAADGKLVLTLVADHDLCTASVALHKADFHGSSPDLASALFTADAASRCARPPADKAMNLRARFEPEGGAPVEELQNAQGASDWAEKQQSNDDKQAILARVARDKQRLSAIVDLVPPSGVAPDQVACPSPIAGPLPRIAYEHLLIIAGKQPPDANNEIAWYYWLSDVGYQHLASLAAPNARITAAEVGEDLPAAAARYVEVVRVEKSKQPERGSGEKREKANGTTYVTTELVPGWMTAMVDVIDVEGHKLACRGRVSVRSSQSISVGSKKGEPLMSDFMENWDTVSSAMERAIAKGPLHGPTQE